MADPTEQRDLFDEACKDIRRNLWILGPEGTSRIINWFLTLTQDAYDRGIRDEKARSAPPTENL